jgi:3-deoxy-manno-octulosonate cytidylyltransferase (CMP-KDO synthetase)
MSTAAHEIHDIAEFTNPNVVKVVIDQSQMAMYFSRAPIPWWRDGFSKGIDALPQPAALEAHWYLWVSRWLFAKLSQAAPRPH